METFVSVCSFFGAWLLVAGPIYQAAIELREENEDTDSFNAKRGSAKLQKPPHISAWWWLLPPVKIILETRRSKKFRKDFMQQLTQSEMETMINFINKATGWLLVSGGGFLIAVKETYELIEKLNWDGVLFWPIIVVLLFLCFANTAYRSSRSDRVIASSHK